jgi:hypothetical protein
VNPASLKYSCWHARIEHDQSRQPRQLLGLNSWPIGKLGSPFSSLGRKWHPSGHPTDMAGQGLLGESNWRWYSTQYFGLAWFCPTKRVRRRALALKTRTAIHARLDPLVKSSFFYLCLTIPKQVATVSWKRIRFNPLARFENSLSHTHNAFKYQLDHSLKVWPKRLPFY